jgi:hypothetical protein
VCNGSRYLIALLINVIFILTGCFNSGQSGNESDRYLKEDAVNGLKATYAEEYTRINIIRGALYKFVISPSNPVNLGVVVGSLEASIFPEEYEYKRLEQLENFSAEIRKEIISQPMLTISAKNREALNHIYNAVIKPLSEKLMTNKPVTVQDKAVLNNAITFLDNLGQGYSALSTKSLDLNSGEAQSYFLSIQGTIREIQKLTLTTVNKTTK